jgi:enoyl-CoA hydratase/carnithine racemase
MPVLLVEQEGPVRRFTLNRPEKRNAFNGELLDAMLAAFSETPGPDERVAVIQANGPAFCAGMDLAERGRATGMTTNIEDILRAVETWPLPVVGIVHGDAIAGGNELALHCDIVVASSRARFGMSLAQIGLTTSWFLTKKLLETAGPVATREILLLGEPLPATRFYELGMIARVAPPLELQATAEAIIARLAANAPLSVKTMKALILREMAFRDDIPHDDIKEMIETVRNSADAKEGILARLEKRDMRFSGR